MIDGLWTMREAAALLGISLETIRVTVKTEGIQPKKHPYNGNARALDRDDLARIRNRLGIPETAEAAK